MRHKRKFRIRYILIPLLVIFVGMVSIFLHFGGMNAGPMSDPKEFARYASAVEELTVPTDAKIVALGEAAHGCREFQTLKKDIFAILVEKYGFQDFVLEGDYGGSMVVEDYIHGGSGSAQEAVSAIGFAIYRTKEMTDLVDWMRTYNETAPVGEDLHFHGMDMQRDRYVRERLMQDCHAYGIEASLPEAGGTYDPEELDRIARELTNKGASPQQLYNITVLQQYQDLQDAGVNGSDLRDSYMADNVEWILHNTKTNKIFVSGHNSHIGKWGSVASMGNLLAEKEEDGYYAIGTDFSRIRDNVPNGKGKRTKQVFYSHDPLANAAKEAGFDICLVDLKAVPEESTLGRQVNDYMYMGSLGERYTFMMRLLPPSYRIFQSPAVLYDSMIFVSDAHPTEIFPGT